jgi:hypothetical protein
MVWKKQIIAQNKVVYTNPSNGDDWVGIGKNNNGTWTVMTGVGLQKPPFSNRISATNYAKRYMQSRQHNDNSPRAIVNKMMGNSVLEGIAKEGKRVQGLRKKYGNRKFSSVELFGYD